jgi:hypothetical protein
MCEMRRVKIGRHTEPKMEGHPLDRASHTGWREARTGQTAKADNPESSQ